MQILFYGNQKVLQLCHGPSNFLITIKKSWPLHKSRRLCYMMGTFSVVGMNPKLILLVKFRKLKMAKSFLLLAILRGLMSLIFVFWVSIWILKPTKTWTRLWKQAEESAGNTLVGYNGFDFIISSLPVISLAMVGLVYFALLPRNSRARQRTTAVASFSNPVIITSSIGIMSSFEIVAVFLFFIFLAWTFYTRISNDFSKLVPVKSMKLDLWQLKCYRVATRFGLLAEACLAMLFLPILRGLSIFQLIGVQFEASVKYHTWLGTAMILFACFHGGGTLFIWAISRHLKTEIWKWQKTGRINLAGEIALVTGLVIWVTSLPQIRRRKFEFFFYTHHLYIIFLIFFLFHAGDRHFYWVFPGIFLFSIDKLFRILQSRRSTCVIAARVFPCRAVELFLPKDPGLKYSPSSVLFVNIPSISQFQWHPFSITSSCLVDDHMVSAMVKCKGKWTSSLCNNIQAALDSEITVKKCIPIRVEGPYGPPTVDFLRHENLLLVAGGIGITPFLSILQEISCTRSNLGYKFPRRIQLVFVVKSCEEISTLNSVSHLLLNPPPHENFRVKLRVFITREKRSRVTAMEILTESFSQVQTVHIGTNCRSSAIFGQENFGLKSVLVGISSVVFLVFVVCFSHNFIPTGKKHMIMKLAASAGKKDAKEKSPSSVVDLIIIASFAIAITFTAVMATILRWRRVKQTELSHVSMKEHKANDLCFVGSTTNNVGDVEHEIHFEGRPNFEDIFSEFGNETRGSNVKVMVCGPESMKESVASMCRQKSVSFKTRPKFSFQSLNFNL